MFSITKPRVPEGLRDLMKDLTREILKENPTDIYTFAEYYFMSRLPEKDYYKVKEFEDNCGKYDFSYIQNSQRYQIPVALVYSIIPESLTNLIKDLIKAILREQPENLCDFAVEYFRHLKATMKIVNPTENIAKEINYSAYENYFNNKERFLLTPYVKCKCGRILGESEDSSYNVIQNDDKKDKNKGRRISEKDFTFTEKYLNSVILIQRYFRRYLKTRNAKTNTNETLKGSAITEQLNQTSNQSKVIIPQLHLNQVETENVPEDASYTSASTALLSASESGRDNSDLSTTESIPTKTIIEREEIENNEKNFPTSHQSHSNETADDDSKSTLNDKKLNTGQGDDHQLTGVQSNKPRNLDIIREIKREKSIEDNKEEPSEMEHCLSNKDINEYAGNSSITEDHKEINSGLFETKPVVDTKIHSNEGENNQNEIINASLQTKEKHLESMQKVSITENMNADSQNTRKTSDRQQENSSIETNVVSSESEAAKLHENESNKPQTHTNNSNKSFGIELENKIFANENVNDNDSLEKNLENLPSNISRDHIISSDVSTEEQKLLKSNKYSKEKNAECVNNDLNDVQVEGLSTEEDVNLMIKNSTLNTDGPKNKDDHVYEHKHGDGNPNNLKSDRESVQNVLTLPVNEENIQTTDATTDKIPCDESENIVDFHSNHEKSEHMDTNNESGILCENQNNLSTLHESNNSFHEQDTTSPIINDEESKTNNDNTREKNENMLNKVKSNDNYDDTISKAHKSELSFPNVNKSDYISTSSIADLIPENHQTGSIVKDLSSSEIFFLENRDMEKEGMTIEMINSENKKSDVTDDQTSTPQTNSKNENNPEQSIHQNEKESQSDEKKSSQNHDMEKDGTPTENINSENTRNDVSDNSETGQKFKRSVVDSVGNDTISDNINAVDQCSTISQTRPSEEEKPEQSTDQNIDMEERKSNEKESQSDENKSFQNQGIEKENATTKKMNSENTRSDVSENSETGQKLKLNVVDSVGNDILNDTISNNIVGDAKTSTSLTNPDDESKPEQSVDRNEKESQSDENKSFQNHDIEIDGTTTENINSENTRSDVSDNSESGQSFKLNVVDSIRNDILNDTISNNIVADAKTSTSLTNPGDESKPEQSIDRNKKESQSDGNKSSQNHAIEKEDTTTEKINSENIRSDISGNPETEQTFKLNVVDSIGNSILNDTSLTNPGDENKPEQSVDRNEKESQSDESKSSQNHDMEKDGTTTENINSENTRNDVSDNSETGQTFKLNVADGHTSTSLTDSSDENKPEQSIDQNEKESQSDENKSSQNHDMETEDTTTEKIHSENIRSDISDNSETGQKLKLNVVDSVGNDILNDTISNNIVVDAKTSTSLTNPGDESKPEQSIDRNKKESQSDGNKSSQNHAIEKEDTTTEKINSENIRSDITGNPETEQTFKLNVVDSIGNSILNDTSLTNPGDENKPEQSVDRNEKESQSDESKSSQNHDMEKDGTTTENINSENTRNDVSDNSETGRTFKLNVADGHTSTSLTDSSDENKPEQSIDQNEKESQSDENKSSQNHDMEKEDTTTEKINSENIRSDITGNPETEQNFELNVVDSVGNYILNDTISNNIVADAQTITSLTNPGDGSKQSIDRNEKESQSDESKSSQNHDIEKDGTTTENINSENTRSDVSDNSETGQTFKLNVADGHTSTSLINTSDENKPEQSIDQNEKESQSDENKSSQNHAMEKEDTTTEKINSENIRSDVSDNSKTGQKFKLNVVDSAKNDILNDTISNTIVADAQASTSLTNPSDENKPEQGIDQNDKESQSDEKKSSQIQDIGKEGTTTEKKNSENIRSDVSDNLNTGQKFELSNVVSVGNDPISDNISAGDQYNRTIQTRSREENKPEQSTDQNIEIEESKSIEEESKSDENKSSQNYDMKKDGSTIEKKNSKNTISDVSDNSETGQKFELNIVDSVRNDRISDNMTSQTNPSEVNKPEQSVDQNIDMEKAKKMKKKQNDPNNVENENLRFENTTTDTTDNLKIKIKSDENCENTNGIDSPENYILKKTILDNILTDEHITPIAPNNDTVCCDISQQNERNLNNNIDTNEENITGIHRNDSKESEIKKTTSKDNNPEFPDDMKIEKSCGDNLLEENCDKNIHINETFTSGTNDEKIHFDDFGSEATDELNLKIVSDITNDENTAEKDIQSKKEVLKSAGKQDKIDQSIEMKRERRDTTPIGRTEANEPINEKTYSDNECIETTDNSKAEICCDEMKEFHDENDVKCTENDNLNKTLSDTVIADNQVNTTIQTSNGEDPNDENLVQRIDIENEKKTEITENGTKVAITEGINFEDTIIKETENSNTEINSDENLRHHDKNVSESIENDILNKTISGKPLTGNKQKLEHNEENLDQNKLKTGRSTDSTQEIHHENVSISDNITKGEQINAMSYEEKFNVNSAQIKCNETRDDTGKYCEKSQELIEHNNLNKAISIENLNVKQRPLTTEENESFEIKHRSGGTISDQTVDKEKESKNGINCDNARCENGNVKSETRFDGIHKSHTEKLNTKANTEEPMAKETDNRVDSAVKCRDEQKISEVDITSNHGSLESSKPTENSNITGRDLITDLKEQPPFILTKTGNEAVNEFDKKKSIPDEKNIELRQLGLITSSDNKDGVMASTSNKTDEGSDNISTLHKHTSSNDSKPIDSCVSTKDNGVGELDKENTPVQTKVSQVDLSASITSNKIEKECKINDDGTITKIASEANENTATTQQTQELSPKDNPNSTKVTKTMENLKTSEDDLAAKDLSAARHLDDFKLNDLNTIDQLELSKEVKQKISAEKLNEINHLEIETNNCSKMNIENNISHNESVNSQDNKLKHTEINNNEGKSNEDLNMMTSHESSHLNVTANESYEDITKIERYIREKRLASDVENDIEIKNQRQQETISHQVNHEAPSNTLPADADGKGEDINDQATTLSIGNKTPVKSVIGIQNFNIDRIRFYNEGLLGSISGQRFAETHLRSFWKEYLMNNSKPLGQYDNETNGIYSNQLLDLEKYETQESKNQHNEKQENTNVEPTIVKETAKDSESIHANKQNLPSTHIINKDVERLPRYFYGALEEREDNKTVASKPKTYKEPLAFVIPIGDINDKGRTPKPDAGKKLTATNSNNETHTEVLQEDLSNNFTNVDLTYGGKSEPLLEAETPPKPFEDLNQFEHSIHDLDLDITYTINEILNLKYEDDLQNNSDENDENENLNDSISDYSLTPEPMLQTIVELSESETPRPLRQLQPNNDNNIDLTAESNEDNSLISDEFLEDENEKTTNDHTHTQTGGIYEYSTNEFDNAARLNDKILHDNSHNLTPNTDTFEEVSKESSAYHDTNANRILLIDSSNKKDEKIESKNRIGNIEACSENISNEEDKTIDYRNKNETDFDETLLDNKQVVSIIDSPPNNDSFHEDLKGIAAKKIQRVYRQHLQKTANRDNKGDLETDDKIKAHDMELDSTMVDSLNTKFNNTDSGLEEIEIDNVKKEEDNIDNSDKTFKDGRKSKEEIKKFEEFSKNSTSYDEQASESVSTNAYSEMKNLNKSTENCNECSSAVTNILEKGYNSNIENIKNQPQCKAEKHHKQHNINDVSPKRETSSITGNLQSELDISPTPNEDSLHENLKDIAAKKIQRVYRQHIQTKTANRLNKDNLEMDDTSKAHDMELVSTTVDSLNTKFSEIDSPEGVIEIENVKKEDNIDERNSKEQDKKIGEFSKNSNNSDEHESEPVNSNSDMKNMNNSIESSSECYSTVTDNLKMVSNSDNENNNNQLNSNEAEKYHKQNDIIENHPSITGNLQSELNVTANDRSHRKPSTSEAANDNDIQVTDTAINTDKAAKIIQVFFKKYIKPKHKSNTNADLQKTHWFVGDEPIVANEVSEPLDKTKSEISFDETEAYVVLTTNLPQYLVDSNSSEAIDTNSFSRTPTAPITNQSSDSCCSSSSREDSLVEKCINLPKGSVLTDVSQPAAVTAPHIGIQSSGANGGEVNDKKVRYTNLIDQFITSERFYSGIVNRNCSYSDIKDIQFPSSNITEITKILTEFLDARSENLKSDIRYEILEEPCIKKTVEEEISSSVTSSASSSSSDIDDAEDSLGTKTVKLEKPEIAIIKMQKRRNSTSKISSLDNLKEYNFNEPTVMSIENLDTDEEGIVVARLQRDETRESTGQSDVDVVIGSTVKEDDSNFHENFNFDSTFPAKGSLKRVHTIGDEVEAKFLLKNVTIDESIKYIEPSDHELNDSSLCLDDETTANIRHKMMAYSLSEADSDVFERTADNHDSSSWELRNKKYDDFNISTALIDNGDTSTETESTTVSAVTKIQAGSGGSFNSSKVSIGNAAISESLEHLVKEAAAKRIQKMYRQHYRLKTANANNKVKSSLECTKSLETTLAQKRSIMLQRGDALRNGSSPEETTNSSNSGEIENNSYIKSKTLPEQESKAIYTDNTTSSCSLPSSAKSAAAIRAKKIEDNKRRWTAMRQNSMPVQIDSEVLRVIPKYIRKKIKSAESEKRKDRRRMLLMD